MATIGDLLFKINQAGLKDADSVEFVILNNDGDEVNFVIGGYDEDNDQFVAVLEEFDVPTPATSDVSAKKQIVSVYVPEGVDVDIIHTTPTAEDTDD